MLQFAGTARTHESVDPGRGVGVRRRDAQLIVQVHGVEDGWVAGERLGEQVRVRVRDAGLLEELDLLADLVRLVRVELPLLALALGRLVLVLGLAREEVAQAHADAVRDEV